MIEQSTTRLIGRDDRKQPMRKAGGIAHRPTTIRTAFTSKTPELQDPRPMSASTLTAPARFLRVHAAPDGESPTIKMRNPRNSIPRVTHWAFTFETPRTGQLVVIEVLWTTSRNWERHFRDEFDGQGYSYAKKPIGPYVFVVRMTSPAAYAEINPEYVCP